MIQKKMAVFEICWEACNKVGGIYTVLASKAAYMKQALGDNNYFIIGPYFIEKAKGEFEEIVPPETIKPIFGALQKEGINCHWGKWLIKGEPITILIDFNGYRHYLNNIKKHLWENFAIDSLNAPSDFDDPILWSWCVGKVLSRIKEVFKGQNIIAHAHEWMSGSVLLYLKEKEPQIKKIFTTHATVLGRALSAANYPLYENLETIEGDKKAYELGIAAKHQIEKASAQKADILTTVSEITSLEVKQFLNRKVDLTLPNGLHLGGGLTFEDFSLSHRLQRDRMREFILHYFFPYYSFDPRKSLFYFISGRYEFHNKGIDIFIDALSDLNKRLKEKGASAKTIVVFFWVPLNIRGIKPHIREAREIFSDVEQTLEESQVTTQSNLLYNIMAEKPLSAEALFEGDTLRQIKRKLMKLKHPTGLPSICTHDLAEGNNAIINKLKQVNLINKAEDKVKVIIYPAYLTGSDGLLNLSYNECIQGSHLGVFPSYYEPWGYTPLETAALGVATITTDLAGFGIFIKPKADQKKYPGIYIVERRQKSYETSKNQLADLLYSFSCASYHERVQNKIGASELAQEASWEKLIKHYIEAYKRTKS
jgi:glycogen(starch) synthase